MQLHEFTLNHCCGHTSKRKFDVDDDDFAVDIAEEEAQICPECESTIEIKAADAAWEKHCEEQEKEIEVAQMIHEWKSLLCNVAQVFDGWHADGTCWSEYDEEVRQGVSKMQHQLEKLPADLHGYAENTGRCNNCKKLSYCPIRNTLNRLNEEIYTEDVKNKFGCSLWEG